MNRNAPKPNIFYKVRITSCDPKHTCQLSHQFYNVAEATSTGEGKISLIGMQTLLHVLKTRPNTCARDLRPLMKQFVEKNQPLDCVFIRNFRQRMAYFIAKNPDCVEITKEDAELISSKKSITADEHKVLNDPFINTNFQTMLRKIWCEDKSTWEVLAYARRCKTELPGYDFRVRHDNYHHPDAISYMTPIMRNNLLRFGTVLFIDMQCRQYNEFNWPYCGIMIKTHEMKIGLVTECLSIDESLNTYNWVIRSMAIMEPRWSPKNVKIIFADQLVTLELLNLLDIKDSCTLRGDYHHLLNEVWPKEDNFGIVVMSKIKHWLKQMLVSPYENEWLRCYEQASQVLKDDPAKRAKLDNIYSNPKYYAGYHVRSIDGNLKAKGSVPAEQNHSSVVAWLGKGATWSIMEHKSFLMQRQQDHAKMRKADEDALHVQCFKFKSQREGQLGVDEVVAKKNLSGYAYREIFQTVRSRAEWLQFFVNDDGSASIWKTGKDPDTCVVTVIEGHQRCNCLDRKSWSHQCEHEYLIDGKFILSKWNHRWYNNHVFQEMCPSLSFIFAVSKHSDTNAEFLPYDISDMVDTTTHENELLINDNVDEYASIDECGEDNFMDNFMPSEYPQDIAQVHSKVTYQDIMIRMGELARTVQNNQEQLSAVLVNVNRMIDYYRKGKNFEVNFVTHDAINLSNTDDINRVDLPLRAITTPLTNNSTKMKRKMSALEYRTTQYSLSQNTVESIGSNHSDLNHLRTPRVRTRRCVLCSGKGHGQYKCVKLLAYGCLPLEKGNETIRQQLSQDLSQNETFLTMKRTSDDNRTILKSLPRGNMAALILHRRLLINENLVDPVQPNNYCVECTILVDGGEEDPRYRLVLFRIGDVSAYVTKSKTNLVVSLLDKM